MKKHICLFVITVFLFATTYAQAYERVIAISGYFVNGNNMLAPDDSSTYRYAGGRDLDSTWGWQLGWEGPQACDTLTDYQYGTGYTPYQMRIRKWSADNKMLSDSIYSWSAADNAFTLNSYNLNSYNGSGQPAESITYAVGGSTIEKIDFGYDASGNNTAQVLLQWNLNTLVWDSFFVYNWTYNTSGQVTSYTDREFGNPGEYLEYGENLYNYDGNGRLDTIVYLGLDQSLTGLIPMGIAVDSYDVNGLLTSQARWMYGTNTYEYLRTYYSYDANGNMIQYIELKGDTQGNWSNFIRYQATYDSYNMITTNTNLNWDTTGGGSWQPLFNYDDYMEYFYYEPYFPSGVANVEAGADVRIYPVPADDMLSVDIQWQVPQAATATIYDAAGRRHGDWPIPTGASYHGYIPVGSLGAGVYTLEIRGSSGVICKTFNVVR